MKASRRIAAIRLMNKIEKFPEHAERIGVEIKIQKKRKRL